MSQNLPMPGSPALAVTNAPSATLSGTVMEKAAAYIADTAHNPTFTPNSTFSWDVGGGTKTFYKGLPVTIPAGLKATLIAAGKGS